MPPFTDVRVTWITKLVLCVTCLDTGQEALIEFSDDGTTARKVKS